MRNLENASKDLETTYTEQDCVMFPNWWHFGEVSYLLAQKGDT